MASAGDVLVNGKGDSITFIKTAADTGGELLEMEVLYQPGRRNPPMHMHPEQNEYFEVLEGSVRVTLPDGEHSYQVGETFEVPAGTPHSMNNGDGAVTRLRWQVRPALSTERFWETMWGLIRDGKLHLGPMPNLLQYAVIVRAFEREFRLVKPPELVQKLVFTPLAIAGQLLGFRATYAQYSQ